MRMLQGQTLKACSLDGSTEAELMRDCHADVCRRPCMTAGPCTAAFRDSKVHVVDSSAGAPRSTVITSRQDNTSQPESFVYIIPSCTINFSKHSFISLLLPFGTNYPLPTTITESNTLATFKHTYLTHLTSLTTRNT